VAGRRDRDQVGDRVDAVLAAGRQDRGEPPLPLLRAEVPGVQPHVLGAGLPHPAHDRLGHDVARGEVGQGVHALHHPGAGVVDEERALPAHRLGDQRLLAQRVLTEPHHRRVELHELQVAQHRPGAQRERHPVAGRDRGVGRGGEHLAQAAAGEHDRAAPDRADAALLALPHHVQGDPGDRAVGGQEQVEGEGVLDDGDRGVGLHGGDERALDLGAGGVAAGVRDPVAQVAALAGQRELARVGLVEHRAERDQLVHRGGALGDEHPHRRLVAQAGAGDEGVAQVLLGGVAGAEGGGDPALRPGGRAGGEQVLGDHEDADLWGGRPHPQGGGQAGDARAHHDHVGVLGPAGGRRLEALGQGDHGREATAARLSSCRRR
jgi:hypothetical protein